MLTNNDKIYVLADTHGSWRPVRDLYIRLQSNKEINIKEGEHPTLIILGDSGLNYFFNKRDDDLKSKLSEYPFTYFIIRGNHEERPSICFKKENFWHLEDFFGNKVFVENEYPCIKYAIDTPSIYQAGDLKLFINPGAYSVDKYYRLQKGWTWFEGEQMTEEEMEYGRQLAENLKVDVILSHTCPIIFEPTDLFLPVVDQSTVDKRTERYLGEIEREVDYRAWLWGHFHKLRDYPRTNGRRKLMLFNDAAIELHEYLEKDELITY